MTRECEDAISRQAVLDLIDHYNSDGLGSVFYGYEQGEKFANEVNKLPSVKPQPKMGRWIDRKCSRCGCRSMLGLCIENYCGNCGAKMQEDEE
jgi:hypothetical protein